MNNFTNLHYYVISHKHLKKSSLQIAEGCSYVTADVYYFTASLSALPGLNAGTLLAAISISLPSSKNPPPCYVAIVALVELLLEPYVQLSKHTAHHPNYLVSLQ